MSQSEEHPQAAQSAKAKAAQYQQRSHHSKTDETGEEKPAERRPVRNEQEYMDLVGQRVEEAMRNGAFDNLRGKGKPLNLERNPYVPEEMELAYSIMKENQISPEWISDRAAMLRAIENFRTSLKQAVTEYRSKRTENLDAPAHAKLAQTWSQYISHFESTVARLNKQILIVNLKQPIVRLEIFQLRLDEELTRAGLE